MYTKDELARRRARLSPQHRAKLQQRIQHNASEQSRAHAAAAIPQRESQLPIPLSFAQQRLWFLQQFTPDSTAYHEIIALRLRGNLQHAILNQALTTLSARHEILRTTFPLLDENVQQIIAPDTDVMLPLIDVSHLMPEEKMRAKDLQIETSQRPFDLAQEAAWRICLLRLDEQEHIFFVCMHHIITDAWSLEIFVREITQLYHSYRQGLSSPLLPLPIQYADYACWQRQWLDEQQQQEQLAYWQKQLVPPFPLLELPLDYPRPPIMRNQGQRQRWSVTPELKGLIYQRCRQMNVTPFMFLLAAFQVLLYRYTSQEEIIVGSPVAGRIRPELEGLLGCFVNTLAFRSQLTGTSSFREILEELRTTALAAYEHQDLPFEKLVEVLQPERSMDHHPIFQIAFVWQNVPLNTQTLSDLQIEPYHIEQRTTRFDFTLVLQETPQEISGYAEFNTDLFRPTTIKQFLYSYERLLTSLARQPEQAIMDISLLTPSEDQGLLALWQTSRQTEPASASCLHQLIEAQVARTPNAIALCFEEQAITYRELDERANQLAHWLCQQDVHPESFVGVLLDRSPELVIAALAILKAGGVYVPFDPEEPAERLASMLSNLRPILLLTQTQHSTRISTQRTPILCLDDLTHAWRRNATTALQSQVQTQNLAYQIYTSGSTGSPKGVMITHQNIIQRVLWQQEAYPLTATDTTLFKMAVCFDPSISDIFCPLSVGARIVIARAGGQKDHGYLLDLIQIHHINFFSTIPSALRVMQQEPAWDRCTSLRMVMCGGEPLSSEICARFISSHPQAQLINLYGPTEATIQASSWSCTETAQPAIPIGYPVSDTQLYVLDALLQPVPIGMTGELYIGGVGLARGYWQQPDITAAKFLPHPYATRPGERIYRTGDLARYTAAGRFEFVGRTDDQVKIRGFRIELAEIERVLRLHDCLQNVIVLTQPEEPQLLAYLSLRPNCYVAPQDLQSFLQERLPTHMIPAVYIYLADFPLLTSGKIDRKRLPPPDLAARRALLPHHIIKPREPISEILTTIWSQLLKVSQVGVEDNFFALGGHSLLATQMSAQVRKIFGIELSLSHFFATPTIAAVAAELQGQSTTATPNLQAVSRAHPLPTSFSQQQQWLQDQLAAREELRHIFGAVQLQGSLDIEVLQSSFELLIQRHEALRTTFQMSPDGLTQHIHASGQIPLAIINLQKLTQQARTTAIATFMDAMRRYDFDLVHGPLLAASLLRLQADTHLLLIAGHHIIFDGWSTEIFLRDLAQFYTSRRTNVPAQLPALPLQYADYAVWQQQSLQAERQEMLRQYWQQQLINLPVLQLPHMHTPPQKSLFRAETCSLQFSQQQTQIFIQFCQREGITLYMLFLAALQALLARYSGQDDIVIGSPIAGRNVADMEHVIGSFMNTLLLRVDLSGNPSFRTLLTRVRQSALGAYAHQELPFDQLRTLLPDAEQGEHPSLFQVLFALQNTPEEEKTLPDIAASFLPLASQTTPFELDLTLWQAQEQLLGSLKYNAEIFDPELIERFNHDFQALLELIVADPEQHIASVQLISSQDALKLLQVWNNTEAPYAQHACIHQLFEEQAERTPDALAALYNDTTLTYQQLNQQANRIAHLLLKQGKAPQQQTALLLDRSLEMLPALLGILKAGNAYIPLEPDMPSKRLYAILSSCTPTALLTQSKHLELLTQLDPLPALTTIVCLDECSRDEVQDHAYAARELQIMQATDLLVHPTHNPPQRITADALAYIIFTSGSTGTPKGVMVQHRAVINLIEWVNQTFLITPQDRLLFITSLCFDLSVYDIFGMLAAGGSIQIVPATTLQNPEDLLNLLYQEPITFWDSAPAAFGQLLPFLSSAPQSSSQLRLIFLSGDWIPISMPDQLRQAFPKAEVVSLGGATEATIWSNFFRIASVAEEWISIPYGRPLQNARYYILDDYQQLCPPGVAGELYIGGQCLALGYTNDPGLTAAKFLPSPFAQTPGERLYRTGDLARFWHDGMIEFLGRRDTQVKIRGFRIETGEVEAALLHHPAIQAAIVLVQATTRTDKKLIAYLVPKSEHTTLSYRALRAYLSDHIPDYMLPSSFIWLAQLPLAPTGKVDRQALTALAQETSTEDDAGLILPQTPQEILLAQIWSKVLGREQVGVTQDFFELGGHSLLATQVVAQIRQLFQINFPLRAIFEQLTIERIALQLIQLQREQQHFSHPSLQPRTQQTNIPLSFTQERLWFLDQFNHSNGAYNLATAIRLTGSIDVPALANSLTYLVARHEVLRTTFAEQDGIPQQIIHAPQPFALLQRDLTSFEHREREELLPQILNQEAQYAFDLAQGPLMRVQLVRLNETENVLMLTIHHIITDGWSMQLLIQELITLYQHMHAGEPLQLPEQRLHYADYTIWQRHWMRDSILEQQLAYWKKQLAHAPILTLPTDYPRPAQRSFRGAQLHDTLPLALLKQLQRLSKEENVTLFMTLLAAFQILLARSSGQEEIIVGTSIANRPFAEMEQIPGFFVNTLALRTDLSADPDVRTLLHAVRETCLMAYTHQDLPFEKIVDALQPTRTLSQTPLFQALIVLQNQPGSTTTLPDLSAESYILQNHSARYDLSLYLTETEDGLTVMFEYSTDLFAAETIQLMMQRWQLLLEGIVAHPDQKISMLPLMTSLEQQQILKLSQGPHASSSSSRTLSQLFEEQVRKAPEALALLATDNTMLTYTQLNRQANQLAHALYALERKTESCLGVYLERSFDLVVALLATLKIGATYVILDPELPEKRLAFLIADASLDLIITRDTLQSTIPATAVPTYLIDAPTREQQPEHNLELSLSTELRASIVYTSGSTGQPLGVETTHAALLNRFTWMWQQYPFAPDERSCHKTSFNFVDACGELFGPLLQGCSVLLFTEEQLRDFHYLVSALQTYAISRIVLVPALLRAILEAFPQLAELLPDLRYWTSSGETLTLDLIQSFRQQLPGKHLLNLYGSSEVAADVTYHEVSEQETDQNAISIGVPISNTGVYLLDRQQQLIAPGIVGEIYLAGAQIARGYHRRPDMTALRFLPHPWSLAGGARLYRTGDLGYRTASGLLYYLGRSDQQLKWHGFRIDPTEIEMELRRHPAIREGVVQLKQIANRHEDATQLVAYLVPDSDEQAPLTRAHIRAFLQEHLPEYMLPTQIIWLPELPLLPTGKVDRQRLLEMELPSDATETALIMARTPQEELLVDIWRQILKLDVIGTTQDFFTLGGHSLLATQVISRIRHAFQVELSVRILFETPTIVELSAQIDQARTTPTGLQLPPPPTRISRPQTLPLSFEQERLWFLEQLTPGNPAQTLPITLRLRGPFHLDILQQSLNALSERHEILRTIFPTQMGRPEQIILPAGVVPIAYHEVAPEQQSEETVQQQIQQVLRQPIDLMHGPIWRVSLWRLSPEDHVLLIHLHHIIADGWSVNLLLQELATFYQGTLDQQTVNLPALPLQFADYALWQRQWLQGELLQHHLDYWTELLAQAPFLALPTDYPRPEKLTFNGARQASSVSPEIVLRLKSVSQQEHATLFMTLFTALHILLAAWTEQQDIVIGTVIANRTQLEVEHLIGCFINILPIRIHSTEQDSASSLLARVRATLLEAYTHQECYVEKIVQAVQPDRSANQHPLYSIAFLLQNYAPVQFPDAPSGSLQVQAQAIEAEYAQMDLRFVLEETESGLTMQCEYNTDLFAATTINTLLTAYQSILTQLGEQPAEPLTTFVLPRALLAQAEDARRRDRKQQIIIASNFTAEPIQDTLRFWMHTLKFPSTLQIAPYNQIMQQLLDPQSLFTQNSWGFNLVLLSLYSWYSPAMHDAETGVYDPEPDAVASQQLESLARLEQQIVAFTRAVHAYTDRTHLPLLLTLCPPPPDLAAEIAAFIADQEERLLAELGKLPQVFVKQTHAIQQSYPVAAYYDAQTDELGKIPYTPLFFTSLGTSIARTIHAYHQTPYKVLVLDCDNTLWQGFCGEDGVQGITLDQAAMALQEFVVAQYQAGMLICLCSKNDEQDVLAVFEHYPDMPLRREQLISWRINWRSKSSNLQALSQELSLGLESFIFLDDDALECAEVQAHCPQVLTLQLPAKRTQTSSFLRHLWAFDRLHTTDEDSQRTQFYRADQQRRAFEQKALSFEDFIAELDLRIEITPYDHAQLARIAQLTWRTNQFNMTTRRRTEAELQQLLTSASYQCLTVKVSDRFGAYGLVGLLIFSTNETALVIDTFLLSCRALGRRVEHQMLTELGKIAQAHGLPEIHIPYIPSTKNLPARTFLHAVKDTMPGAVQETDTHFSFSAAAIAMYRAPLVTNQPGAQMQTAARTAPTSAMTSQIGSSQNIHAQILQEIATELEQVTTISERVILEHHRQTTTLVEFVAPRTPLEMLLTQLWQEILHIEQVGIYHNFFELGGDSLQTTMMIAQINTALAINLPLQHLFAATTVADLASILSTIVEADILEEKIQAHLEELD